MAEKPEKLPVRKIGDSPWEVLIVGNDRWLSCESEDDARIIAASPIYEYDSLERVRSGSEFAKELLRLAQVLEKYKMGFGARFFRWRAEEAKGN